MDTPSEYYFCREGSEVEGPVSASEIRDMLTAGTLPLTSQICAAGSNDWQSATVLQRPAPPPPRPRETVATVQQVPVAELPRDKTLIASGKVIGGLSLIIAGIALCFTLVGGLFGLPMIIWGFYIMVKGPADLMTQQTERNKLVYSGACPYCGHFFSFDGPTLGQDCPACRKRFVVRNDRFVALDDSTTQ